MLVSGKLGYTSTNGTPYRFAKWGLPLKCNTPKVNNFVDAPFAVFVPGIFEGTMTAQGPYDAGNMPLTIGNTYIWTLGVTANIFLTVSGILNSLNPTNDVDGNPAVDMGIQLSGPFGLSIV